MPNRISKTVPDPDRCIVTLRGQRVILAHDLALLYSVAPKALNQAVVRNPERFPEDFMFSLTGAEIDALIQSSADPDRRASLVHSRRVRAFTEHGVAMLSSVLSSPRAVRANIQIVRAFVRMRRDTIARDELRRRLARLEKSTDKRFREVFETIETLIADDAAPRPRIGFQAE